MKTTALLRDAILILTLSLAAACGSSDTLTAPDGVASSNNGGASNDGGGSNFSSPDASAPNDGGDSSDAHHDPPPPTPIVGACNGLAAVGTFEDITPPPVKAAMTSEDGRTFAFAADPVNQGTVYLGTIKAGVWKSTDCGATWTHISTGRSGAVVDSGMNWTFKVDPQAPNIVYTNSGYGSSNGLLKSTNGGVDWDPIWPPPAQPNLAKAFTYNFANVIAMDPSDHLHILLTFHETCLAPHPATCIAETFDGGQTWSLLDGHPTWSGNEGQIIFFLNGSKNWLWGSQSNGFWTTTNGGGSWTAITSAAPSHLQSSGMLRTASGAFLVAASDGVFRSPDGQAWTLVPKTGPIVGGIVSDGTAIYTSTCYFPNFCNTGAPYLKSVDDGKTWTTMPSPKMPMGGSLDYDLGHGLMYSSNGDAFWRVRTK
jgi:photosystem II stability/assembly factor-like uncharacterized protein